MTRRLYADDCPRVYTRTGTRAHLLTPLASPNTCRLALCGTGPQWWDSWRGTGSQTETETAASLPVCKACLKQARAVDAAEAKLAGLRQERAS